MCTGHTWKKVNTQTIRLESLYILLIGERGGVNVGNLRESMISRREKWTFRRIDGKCVSL